MNLNYHIFAIVIFVWGIITSCSPPKNQFDSLNFDAVVSKSIYSDSTYVIIAGDLSTYSQIKDKKGTSLFSGIEYKKTIKYVFCDFSMRENLNAYRLFNPQNLPLVIIVRQSKIIGITDKYQDLADISKYLKYETNHSNLSSYQEKDNSLITLMNRLYLIQNKLRSEYYNDIHNDINFILACLNNSYNIYLDYLLARLYDKIGNDEETTRINNRIFSDERFINNPLYYSITTEDFGKKSIHQISTLKIDSLRVDLGKLKKGDTIECQIGLHNISTSNIIVYQIAASCSCVELSCTKIIPSQESTNLKIKFHATDSPGDFHKEIFITTNGTPSNTRIPIIGSIHL